MTMNMPQMGHPTPVPSHSSPSSSSSNYVSSGQSPMSQSHHRPGNLPPMGPSSSYQTSFQQGPPQPSGLHNQWYGPHLPIAQQMVQQAASQPSAAPAPKTEEWDDTYLAVLSTQDLKQLRELLARSNPEIIMPSSGSGPLSQAVILTLVHRVSGSVVSMHINITNKRDSSQLASGRHLPLRRRSSLPFGGCSVQRQP